MHDGKIGVRKARGAVAELREQRTAFGLEALEAAIGEARDAAHRPVILAHQLFGRNQRPQLGDLILPLEAEFIVVAAAQIMEEAADLKQHRIDPGDRLAVAGA